MPLFLCIIGTCSATKAITGVYVDPVSNGLIICKSATNCVLDSTRPNNKKYYLNYSGFRYEYPLIVCDTSGCKSTNANIGNYLNSYNNNVIYCLSSTFCNEYSVNTSSVPKFYVNNGDDKNSKPLIKCVSKNCSTFEIPIETNYKYYYNDDNDKYTKPLIKCTKVNNNYNCVTTQASTGYYINNGNNKLIYCKSPIVCNEVDIPSTHEYYINGDDKNNKQLIECINRKCSIIEINTGNGNYCLSDGYYVDFLSSNKIDYNPSSTPKYYLNGDSNKASKPLITVVNKSCKTSEAKIGCFYVNNKLFCCKKSSGNDACKEYSLNTSSKPVYYLNIDGSRSSIPLLKCVTSNCSVSKAIIGVYIDPISNGLIFCKSETNCVLDSVIPKNKKYYLNSSGNKNEHPLIVCDTSGCKSTNANIGNYLNSLYDNNVIYCQSSTVCNEYDVNTSSVPILYVNNGDDKNSKPLIKCVSSKCSTFEIPTETNNKYYFNNGSDKNVKPLIKCIRGSCVTVDVSIGHYLNNMNDHLIYCESTTLCKEVNINTSSTSSFYINKGNDKNSKTFIKCVNGSCTITSAVGGYIDSSTNDLIYCESTNNCNIITKNTSNIPNYYPNNGDDKNEKPIIECANSSCKTITASIGAYLNSGTNKIVYCKSTTACNEISINNSTTPEYYLNNKNDNAKPLIECVSGKCTTVDVSIGYYLSGESNNLIYCEDNSSCNESNVNTSTTIKYFFNNGGDKNENPLIKCNKNECEITEITTGYYINGANNKSIYCKINEKNMVCNEVTETSTTPKYYIDVQNNPPLIECISGICNKIDKYTFPSDDNYYLSVEGKLIICKKNGCNNFENIYDGYYINSGKDNNEKPLIHCSNKSCSTEKLTSNDEFYLPAGVNNLSSILIHCTEKGCSKENNITKKEFIYYLNAGADKESKQLIECKEEGCSTVNASPNAYYLSYLSYKEDKLVYCDNDKKCEIITSELDINYDNSGGDKETNNKITCSRKALASVTSKVYKRCKYTGDFVFYVNDNVIYMDWEGNSSWGPYEENSHFKETEVYLLSCTPDNKSSEEVTLNWEYGCSKVINHGGNENYEVIIPNKDGCANGYTKRKWENGKWIEDKTNTNTNSDYEGSCWSYCLDNNCPEDIINVENRKNFYCYFEPSSGKQHYPDGIVTQGWDKTNTSIQSCMNKVSSWGGSLNPSCISSSRNTPNSAGSYCGWCEVWCETKCENGQYCKGINNVGPYNIITEENIVEGEKDKEITVKAHYKGNDEYPAESIVLYRFKYECQFFKKSNNQLIGSSACKNNSSGEYKVIAINDNYYIIDTASGEKNITYNKDSNTATFNN